jgi:hypothetical protein
MADWIMCKERLPEFGKVVNVVAEGQPASGFLLRSDRRGHHWAVFLPIEYDLSRDERAHYMTLAVTHWMPLPEMPRV